MSAGETWGQYTGMAKALVYLRECITMTQKAFGGTDEAAFRRNLRNLLSSSKPSRSELLSVAAGCMFMLAKEFERKPCPGESVTPALEVSSVRASLPTKPTSGNESG